MQTLQEKNVTYSIDNKQHENKAKLVTKTGLNLYNKVQLSKLKPSEKKFSSAQKRADWPQDLMLQDTIYNNQLNQQTSCFIQAQRDKETSLAEKPSDRRLWQSNHAVRQSNIMSKNQSVLPLINPLYGNDQNPRSKGFSLKNKARHSMMKNVQNNLYLGNSANLFINEYEDKKKSLKEIMNQTNQIEGAGAYDQSEVMKGQSNFRQAKWKQNLPSDANQAKARSYKEMALGTTNTLDYRSSLSK